MSLNALPWAILGASATFAVMTYYYEDKFFQRELEQMEQDKTAIKEKIEVKKGKKINLILNYVMFHGPKNTETLIYNKIKLFHTDSSSFFFFSPRH